MGGVVVSVAQDALTLLKAGLPRSYEATAQMLSRMVGEGLLVKDKRGELRLPDAPGSTLSTRQDEGSEGGESGRRC